MYSADWIYDHGLGRNERWQTIHIKKDAINDLIGNFKGKQDKTRQDKTKKMIKHQLNT